MIKMDKSHKKNTAEDGTGHSAQQNKGVYDIRMTHEHRFYATAIVGRRELRMEGLRRDAPAKKFGKLVCKVYVRGVYTRHMWGVYPRLHAVLGPLADLSATGSVTIDFLTSYHGPLMSLRSHHSARMRLIVKL